MRELCWKARVGETTFDRCWGVPISKYSVLEGFRQRRLTENQLYTSSNMEDSFERLSTDSEEEKEKYSWVSSA